MKKVLVVTPRFPYPESGACEQDRAEGFRQLQRLGCAVRIVGKYFDWQNPDEISAYWKQEGIEVVLVLYQKKKKFSWILDGAAAEYADPAMQRAVEIAADEFRPDVAWFDYTYLWPLYRVCKKRRIPIIVRSINVESEHFLDEDGRTFVNYLKSVPKYFSEIHSAKNADMLLAITPKEEEWYNAHGGIRVATLPLRALPKKLGTHFPRPREADPLHVFFSGSTYTVSHNRRALVFILKELAPTVFQKYGNDFLFHITGAKFPKELEEHVRDNVIYEGFEATMYDTFLGNMDIAVVPSFFGCGMQQKIFEPLARGFPTMTHARGIAGYPFVAGVDYLAAEDVTGYVQALANLRSIDKRRFLSENCTKKSMALFNRDALDGIVRQALETL